MPTLVTPGHPDWQDFPSWRQSPQFNASETAINGAQVLLAQFPTANFGSLFMRAYGANNGGQMRVGYADSNAFSPETFSFEYTFNQFTDLAVNVPVLGNWARVHLFAPAAQSVTVNMETFLNNNNAPIPQFQNSVNFINLIGVTVPASTFNVYYLAAVQPGPAEVYFGPYDTLGKVQLNIRPMFSDGTFGAPFYFLPGPTGPTPAQPYLPNYPIQVVLNNTDTVNHQLDFSLWPAGGTF